MLTLIAATATLSGLTAAVLPAMQIATILRARTSKGISIPYLAGGLANNAVWTVYAFAFQNVALILPNVIGLAMNVTMLTVAIRFRAQTAAPLVAHVAQAVVHDDELAAEFAQLLTEIDPEQQDGAARRRGALIAALADAA